MSGAHRLAPRLRLAAAAAALAGSLSLTGCGFDAQTLQTYTPAHGINVDADGLKVRNLLIIANDGGQGRLSASLTSQRAADALVGVTGTALKGDGSDGGPLTIGAADLPLPAGRLVVLTDPGTPAITVSGAGLTPGLTARLRLEFRSGVARDVVVPVLDAAHPIYRTAAPELSA